jgi:plastocyanin
VSQPRTHLLSLILSLSLYACASDDDMPMAVDGGGAHAVPTLNGCTSADYVDHSADVERVITIAGAGLTYSPKCMIIAAGQVVRFQGSLTAHPLSPGNPEDPEAGSADNPIAPTSTGQSIEVTFPAAGTYPYHCTLHAFGAGQGMAGSIHVR